MDIGCENWKVQATLTIEFEARPDQSHEQLMKMAHDKVQALVVKEGRLVVVYPPEQIFDH
tara:strand:- start:3125 stop:3304 length:180 start_codon:yes stop_codon:yes gene_type:complete